MLIAYHGVTRDLGRLQSDQPLRRLLRRLGEKALRDLLALDRADDGGKGTQSAPIPLTGLRPLWTEFYRSSPA